jgi:hypothetical protein
MRNNLKKQPLEKKGYPEVNDRRDNNVRDTETDITSLERDDFQIFDTNNNETKRTCGVTTLELSAALKVNKSTPVIRNHKITKM